MEIIIPQFCLILLIGASGSGKSTFAQKFFKKTEILSSDSIREMITDDESNQDCNEEAFYILHKLLSMRLKRARITIVDATNSTLQAREALLKIAHWNYADAIAIIFDFKPEECNQRNLGRNRVVPIDIIEKQYNSIQENLKDIYKEGFSAVYKIKSLEELNNKRIIQKKMPNDLTDIKNPLDIIGDVHGCLTELKELILSLGYTLESKPINDGFLYHISHPQNRKLVFLGDIVDRGPDVPGVIQLVKDICKSGMGYCLKGNHELKLLRKWNQPSSDALPHGLNASLSQLAKTSPEFRNECKQFLNNLDYHYRFDLGNIVVAHAGLKEVMHGKETRKVWDFAMYGDVTGEKDEYGLPVRKNWARFYYGKPLVVYGHTPVREPLWENNTVNIDTGCVFGGKLTALRYPERQTVFVQSKKEYYSSPKPFL